MAATRNSVIEDYEQAAELYRKLTDPQEKFDLIRGDIMRASNRAYQIARTEAQAPVTDPEPVINLDASQPTVKELRSRARDLDIKGASKMSKAELITAIDATVG